MQILCFSSKIMWIERFMTCIQVLIMDRIKTKIKIVIFILNQYYNITNPLGYFEMMCFFILIIYFIVNYMKDHKIKQIF